MVKIDFLEILKTIRMCEQNPYYKVGVFMSTMDEVRRIYTDIVDAIRKDEDSMRSVSITHTQLRSRIEFNNASSIQFVLASENARGCKFNRVLYGENINNDILQDVIKHTEFRYRGN